MTLKREAVAVVVLAVIGAMLGLGSIMVISQDAGSCPAQPVGFPYTCDHAYLINGTYVWMRPLYTDLGVASAMVLISAVALALYLFFGGRPSQPLLVQPHQNS